ncbi:signalosome subunit [Diaporthe helianthi]|uniref:COP9 signalosome complex subunit 6 n=1 Tax=Diaporthe helianthi TaxID=158607 RepID=A0A2P5I9X8_DIAHE|nr:signalosome subunit [Diaporthe helianthi]
MESVILHPMPVINIGDYVTRHYLRKQPGPIVGALFGQQNGREVTIEHAYEVKTLANGDQVTVEPLWFETRLEQMRLVHKDRALDLVGWFTVNPRTGPGNHVLAIHNQVLSYNESAVLLGFHRDEVGEESAGGRLPFTVYETTYEVDDAAKDTTAEGEDREMKDGDSQLKLKFRELPFTVETHEAEMIGMTSVAGAAANAASERVQKELLKLDVKGKGKGKAKEAAGEDKKLDPETVTLSKEDEEMISALTTKANAIKMLQARIDLIIKYLQKLPPPYMDKVNSEVAAGEQMEPSQTLLRLVQALVHRLSIVEPSDAEAFKEELLSEENDVSTIQLLTELMNRAGATRDIGRKFHAIETERAHNSQRVAAFASQGPGFGHPQHGKGGRPGSLSAAGDLM